MNHGDNKMSVDRNEGIKRIKAALRASTGKAWSVTGGRGTSWGWIDIQGLPRNRVEFGYTSEADRELLRTATGEKVFHQGLMIAPDQRGGFVERVEAIAGVAVAIGDVGSEANRRAVAAVIEPIH